MKTQSKSNSPLNPELEMLHAHTKLQRLVLRFLSVPTLVFFIIALVITAAWQIGVILFSFVLLIGIWFYAYNLTKHKKLKQSVFWISSSVILIEAISMMVLNGCTPSAIVACIIVIIYCSLFSKQAVVYSTAGTILAYFISATTDSLQLIPQYELKGVYQLLYDGFFMLLLLPVISYLLRWSFNLKDILSTQTNILNQHRQEIIKTAKSVSLEIDDVVKNLNELSVAFSHQASEQASAISESSQSVSQINKIAEKTADAAQSIEKISTQTKEKSSTTLDRLTEARQGFNIILGTNEDAKLDFSELASLAENIDEVLHSNREIAARIKILAVNAGIQAAKAGSYGSGFNVVARELKSMIVQTESSLEDSSTLLESIREKAKSSAVSIESSSTLLLDHYEELDATGELVEEISNNFSKASAWFKDISLAAKQQLTGINEVKTGIVQIDTAAQSLNSQAQALLDSVKKMNRSQKDLQNILTQSVK